MGLDADLDQQVAFGTAVETRFPLPAQADLFALFDAGRNLDADCVNLARRSLNTDLGMSPRDGRAERNLELGFQIGPGLALRGA